jgi:anion-transporting  ArsA/GET3 family ATPase
MTSELALDSARLLLCLGSGGVGKTTVSAALGIRAALNGRSTALMTVDPAPRLLDALGLDSTSSAIQPVNLHGLGARRGAHLDAMRLDPREVFDRLVTRYAPSPGARAAIQNDRIYRNLAGALSGVSDYMAMEQLLELMGVGENAAKSGASDAVVIDTPPAMQAFDFLDAPRRMLELLGSRAVTLLAPRGRSRDSQRRSFSVIDLAARLVLGAFDRITGLHLLTDVQTFVRNFDGMYEGFAERAAAAQALIREESSAIVLVTIAEPERIAQTHEFIASLSELELKPAAIVVNRVMPPVPDPSSVETLDLPAALVRKLKRNLADFEALRRRAMGALAQLRASLPPETPILIAPELAYEPRSLADLVTIARHLHAAGEQSSIR